MVGFCKYCKLQFPATMSTISYKIFVGKRKLKAITKKVVKLSIEKLKSGALLVAKIVRRLCVETYYIIIKSCKIVKLIRFKTIQHMKDFAQYCNLQFVILKFRIRNIKSYKRKLIEQANEIKEEKIDKVNNALVVVNYRLVLYKINILRIVKKYLERLGLLVIKSLARLSKYSKKEWYEFKGLVNELKQVLKKKYCIFWNSVKEFLNKVVLHLQGFYEYCVEQIAILKLKISNKMHHIKSINEFNENIHIEETKDALILVKSGIERFETKLLVRIVVVLKKVIVAVEKAKQRICYKVLYAFKENSKKGQKKNRPLFAVRAKKEPTPNCREGKKTTHKLSLRHFVPRANLRTDPKLLKEIAKQTHEAMIKNMEISIPELEEELKRRKERKVRITFIKTLSYSAMVIIAFAIITSTSFFKILQVSGSSMEPNLHEGELLITSSFFKFEKGDMVAFYYNDSVLIKRVIATEGDVVYIEDDGTVFVNSVKLEEDYVKELSYGNCDITFPYQVPKDSVFILGDNREVSIDSRSKSIGCISNDKIIGKIQFKLNPFVIY